MPFYVATVTAPEPCMFCDRPAEDGEQWIEDGEGWLFCSPRCAAACTHAMGAALNFDAPFIEALTAALKALAEVRAPRRDVAA